MRVTKIVVDRFKGFYDEVAIDLNANGKNLLVFGENGSGKSSLVRALRLFLDSGTEDNNSFNRHRNIFAPTDGGRIKVALRENRNSREQFFEWSPTVKQTNTQLIRDASKAKGFLDYRSILETYFLHRNRESVNLFSLLIDSLLANTVNDITGNLFFEDWQTLNASIPSRHTAKQLQLIEERLQNFNQGMLAKLNELLDGVNQLLEYFEYDMQIASFVFEGIEYNYKQSVQDRRLNQESVFIKVNFSGRELDRHHLFLNEAKLSAVALAIYLSALRLIPPTALKILILDDVLIGLDMSNRLPVLDILEALFEDYQIFITTYDRHWYEMVRLRTEDSKWKYIELHSKSEAGHEIPIYFESWIQYEDYLSRAEKHLEDKDYSACAVYVRMAFETQIKQLAKKKRLKVTYQPGKPHSSQQFWDAINQENLLSPITKRDIETYRTFVLNPLSHSHLNNTHRRELKDSIVAVKNLGQEIRALLRR